MSQQDASAALAFDGTWLWRDGLGWPLSQSLFRLRFCPTIHSFPRALRQFVGQVGNLRPIGNRPSGITYKCPHRLRLTALWGSQFWLQPAFSRLSPPVRRFPPQETFPPVIVRTFRNAVSS